MLRHELTQESCYCFNSSIVHCRAVGGGSEIPQHLDVIHNLIEACRSQSPPQGPVQQLPRAVAIPQVPAQLHQYSEHVVLGLGLFRLLLWCWSRASSCAVLVLLLAAGRPVGSERSHSFLWLWEGFRDTFFMEEHALLGHWQEKGAQECQGDGSEGNGVEMEVGHVCQGNQQLSQHCGNCGRNKGDAPAIARHSLIAIGADDAVDVGVIGDLGGCHHPVEEFHHLHGHHAVSEEQQEPGDDVADALEEEDGLVAHVVCDQEDREQECEVGVCPNGENLVGDLEGN